MRILIAFVFLILTAFQAYATTYSYTPNPNITIHLDEKLTEQERANVLEGIRRVEAFFQKETGDRFELDTHVVVYYSESFLRKHVPARQRDRDCGGGYSTLDEQKKTSIRCYLPR